MMEENYLQSFEMNLEFCIRFCREDDLPKLEWCGMFTMDAHIIERSFIRQQKGENLMLVCEANDFPVAQVWIDLTRHAADSAGLIWALRVLPGLRGMGIGTRLVRCAEQVLARREFEYAELSVEAHNTGARRLYERLGYSILGDDGDPPEEYAPNPGQCGAPHIAMRKPLPPTREHVSKIAPDRARYETAESTHR